jgi:hypothetical protein
VFPWRFPDGRRQWLLGRWSPSEDFQSLGKGCRVGFRVSDFFFEEFFGAVTVIG